MRVLTNLALALLTFFVTLGGIEAYFRWFDPQLTEFHSLFERDPELGWVMVPEHAARIIEIDGLRQEIRTNSHGFRDADFDAIDPEADRIVAIGDSFVANLAVPADDVFTEVMERQLPEASVMNFGVSGYGQVQELLVLERVLREASPDLVLLFVYPRNDVTDNTGTVWFQKHARPTARLVGERLVVEAPADVSEPTRAGPPAYERLHGFHFFRNRFDFLRARIGNARTRRIPGRFRPSRATPPELYLAARRPSDETRALYRLTERLLLELVQRCREAGVPVALVMAPSFVDVKPALWDRMLASHDADASDYSPEVVGRRFRSFAAAHGVPFLDLLPALREAAAKEPMYSLVHKHWTVQGNRVVARAVLEFLRSQPGLLPDPDFVD